MRVLLLGVAGVALDRERSPASLPRWLCGLSLFVRSDSETWVRVLGLVGSHAVYLAGVCAQQVVPGCGVALIRTLPIELPFSEHDRHAERHSQPGVGRG